MGRLTAENSRTARIARRRWAICISKENTAGRESVEVRRNRLGMATQATDPIIQIVDGNEQDIGLICVNNSMTAAEEYQRHERCHDLEYKI
jgi:hypothetical protein